jgi:dTDP-glucose 4,6-dehydratase
LKLARILVTGGHGFIGSNLVRELRARGHETHVADIVSFDDPLSTRCDVGRFRQVEKMIEEHEYEFVYHLAAEYGRWNGEDYYENLWNTNVVGTKNMIRMQERKKFRMVFFSSAEVYGDYDGVMKEDVMDTVAIKQMNDYAMGKWVGEMQVLNSAAMFGTESVRVRPFNVYGPGEHYTPYRGFVPKFIYQALKGRRYTVYKGHQRTLEYIDDFCRAVANIADNFRAGEVYNLGGNRKYEIKEVSDMILKSAGKDDSIVDYREAEGFTTRAKTPDSSKAVKDLGLKFMISVEEGIARTVEWFRAAYGGQSDR